MKWIDDIENLWRLYSVWVYVAIVFVSLGDVALTLYKPTSLAGQVIAALGSAALAILGIWLRAIPQELPKKKENPDGPDATK